MQGFLILLSFLNLFQIYLTKTKHIKKVKTIFSSVKIPEPNLDSSDLILLLIFNSVIFIFLFSFY